MHCTYIYCQKLTITFPPLMMALGSVGSARREKGILASTLTPSNTISTFSGTLYPRLSTIEKDTLKFELCENEKCSYVRTPPVIHN